MQYGICGGLDISKAAAIAGFDFVERTVGDLLKPREDRAAFDAALAETRAAGLPCPVVNCFIPGDMKITGEAVDTPALERFAATAFERAAEAAVDVIVFGSGGARRNPDGFDPAAAHQQLVRFGQMLGALAGEGGVTVAVEPLNRKECNVLTTVGQCAALVREVDHPAVRLLVDAYHLLQDGDSLQDVTDNADLLVHVHVATVPNRLAPGTEESDLRSFFDALARAGYDGRVSIEGKIPDPDADLPKALAHMRAMEERARRSPDSS